MNYNIKSDLLLIRELFQLTQEELANKLQVEPLRIARIELGKSYPREEFIDKFYNFCFKSKLNLNKQKEMFYKEEMKENHILLTHASKYGIEGALSLDKSKDNNDFGKGFYCENSYDNSVSFVCKFPSASIYFIDFDFKGLIKKEFKVDTEWIMAIAYFRGKLENYKNHKIIKNIINSLKAVDYIIAPIADNRMFEIIDTFINGEITDEQCKHCLAATNLGMQYIFISNKSLEHIHILEKCFISSVEKEHYQKEQINYLITGNNKTKLARIQYKGQGKYLEEILI